MWRKCDNRSLRLAEYLQPTKASHHMSKVSYKAFAATWGNGEVMVELGVSKDQWDHIARGDRVEFNGRGYGKRTGKNGNARKVPFERRASATCVEPVSRREIRSLQMTNCAGPPPIYQVCLFTISNPLACNSSSMPCAKCVHSSDLIQCGLLQSGSSSFG